MSTLLKRGACPALSAPMQTGDGLLIRLSPASGGFSPKQLIGLCESAERHGNGIVEVTARGSCQFRGFSSASAARFAEDVDLLGIVVRTGVPVETSPLAGMDPLEIGDAAAVAERIRESIDASGLTGRLGPKVSVVVDGGGQISLDDIAADVRLVAARCQDGVLWHVAIAGDAKTATQLGWYDDDEAVRAALSTLKRIAERGRDARARNIDAGEALDQLRSFASPPILPDISPLEGEMGSFGDIVSPKTVAPAALAVGESKAAGVISPLEGEMSGRTEGGAKRRDLSETTPLPERAFHAGADIHRLNADRRVLPITLLFGHIDASALVDLARRAEALGVTDIGPAPARTLLLICPSPGAAEALRTGAARLGFVIDPTDPRSKIAACPGAPACASGKIAARAIADEVAKSLPPGAQDLSIHISGCEKGCARQAAADITIVGGEKGAWLVVDGTTRARPLAYRSAGGLAKAVAAVASTLHAERPTETARLANKATTALSPAQLACLKAAFEQDGP